MPRNGSGSYSLPAGNPFVPSTVISSTTMNNTMSDIGTALTQSLSNDGQTTPVNNLPMATFRHTNVGNAVARNDYAAAGQVQDSSLQWLTSVAGTNTITASITPSPTAYAAGQTFRLTSAGANTGAVTLNINGLGAKSVTKNGTAALSAGDIASGAVVEVIYDGTQFQLVQASGPGQFIGIQVFSASGTYTPTAGTARVIVEQVGGGGSGGNTSATTGAQVCVGVGGGSGAYARGLFTSGFSGATVTVGAGGTAGGNGGQTSFGALQITAGGTGGGTATSGAPPFVQFAANGAALPGTGGGITKAKGADTSVAVASALGSFVSGAGGASPFGPGGSANPTSTANGVGASAYGAGGGGATTGSGVGAGNTGGSGSSGVVIVYEYS